MAKDISLESTGATMDKKIINRDNIHFLFVICVLIFAVSSNYIRYVVKPSSQGLLYWWPTSYFFIWISLISSLVILFIIARVAKFESYIKNIHTILSVVSLALLAVALFGIHFFYGAVYPDRIVHQSFGLRGVQNETYALENVENVSYDCLTENARGAIHSEVSYILIMRNGDKFNLAEGRDDGKDGGQWIKAIQYVDSKLRERNVYKYNARGNPNLDRCLSMLAEETTAEAAQSIGQILQPHI